MHALSGTSSAIVVSLTEVVRRGKSYHCVQATLRNIYPVEISVINRRCCSVFLVISIDHCVLLLHTLSSTSSAMHLFQFSIIDSCLYALRDPNTTDLSQHSSLFQGLHLACLLHDQPMKFFPSSLFIYIGVVFLVRTQSHMIQVF